MMSERLAEYFVVVGFDYEKQSKFQGSAFSQKSATILFNRRWCKQWESDSGIS